MRKVMKRQELVFIRFGEKGTRFARPALPAEVAKKPDRVWTLYLEEDETKVPELPIVPVHRTNAFMEDYIHDWDWTAGVFRYRSRITEDPVWVLLEYEE